MRHFQRLEKFFVPRGGVADIRQSAHRDENFVDRQIQRRLEQSATPP